MMLDIIALMVVSYTNGNDSSSDCDRLSHTVGLTRVCCMLPNNSQLFYTGDLFTVMSI